MTILPSELGIEGTSSGFSQGLWFLSLPLLSLSHSLATSGELSHIQARAGHSSTS